MNVLTWAAGLPGDVLREVGQWAALLPMAALWINRDNLTRATWYAAVGVGGLSFVVDTLTDATGGSWWVIYLYPVAALLLLAPVVLPDANGGRRAAVLLAVVLSSVLAIQGFPSRPELAAVVPVWTFLAVLAWGRRDLPHLRPGLLLYFGATVPLLVALALALRFYAPAGSVVTAALAIVQTVAFVVLARGVYRTGRVSVVALHESRLRRRRAS